jgi:tRNA G18 (ribose-2'-O)-methylase SpoU
VFAGSRANVSSATGFKHSALSILAIARRPSAVHTPLAEWLPALRPADGTTHPALLVMDAVVKPENVGSLFRTALAFGVAGVLLAPGCADPLYRKAVRASMGGCFKLPYLRRARAHPHVGRHGHDARLAQRERGGGDRPGARVHAEPQSGRSRGLRWPCWF